jgi:hypothetical protein
MTYEVGILEAKSPIARPTKRIKEPANSQPQVMATLEPYGRLYQMVEAMDGKTPLQDTM